MKPTIQPHGAWRVINYGAGHESQDPIVVIDTDHMLVTARGARVEWGYVDPEGVLHEKATRPAQNPTTDDLYHVVRHDTEDTPKVVVDFAGGEIHLYGNIDIEFGAPASEIETRLAEALGHVYTGAGHLEAGALLDALEDVGLCLIDEDAVDRTVDVIGKVASVCGILGIPPGQTAALIERLR